METETPPAMLARLGRYLLDRIQEPGTIGNLYRALQAFGLAGLTGVLTEDQLFGYLFALGGAMTLAGALMPASWFRPVPAQVVNPAAVRAAITDAEARDAAR